MHVHIHTLVHVYVQYPHPPWVLKAHTHSKTPVIHPYNIHSWRWMLQASPPSDYFTDGSLLEGRQVVTKHLSTYQVYILEHVI